MLFGIRFRNKYNNQIIGYFIDPGTGHLIGAKSRIGARRLSDRVRKHVKKRYGSNVSVETFRLR
jgi:hypothetical protein